jgi:hypothetical protein
MFRIETTDTARLKRIVKAGAGALVLGLVLIVINLVAPLLSDGGYNSGNLVFGLFGVLVVVLASHPTYQAAERLDSN